jgi:hypothetical protein
VQIGQDAGNVIFRRIDIRILYMERLIGKVPILVGRGGSVTAMRISLAQYHLDTEPNDSHQAGGDHRNHGLESVTLRLLHVFSPPPQVL